MHAPNHSDHRPLAPLFGRYLVIYVSAGAVMITTFALAAYVAPLKRVDGCQPTRAAVAHMMLEARR